MTQKQKPGLVLQDKDGQYYVFTAEVLARARVSAEKAAELEALMSSDDTAGFSFLALDPGVMVGHTGGVNVAPGILPRSEPPGTSAFGDGSVRRTGS
jgi:hypothetical protein